jgi:HEAT repeat protein
MTSMNTIEELVLRIPPLDRKGTFTAPAWEEAVAVFHGLLKLNATSTLVGMLGPVDDGEDYRIRFILHGMAQYLGRPGKEAERRKFAAALAAELSAERPASVRGFCARQLQVAGGPECVPALGKALADPEVGEYAAQALLAIREGAAAEFRNALDGPSRLAALQALGILKDAESIPALRRAAEAPETRLLAAWALANLGDEGSVDLVLKAADVEPGYERVKATSACFLLAENLATAGKTDAARRIYRHLDSTRTEPEEAYVRNLASRGLTR